MMGNAGFISSADSLYLGSRVSCSKAFFLDLLLNLSNHYEIRAGAFLLRAQGPFVGFRVEGLGFKGVFLSRVELVWLRA